MGKQITRLPPAVVSQLRSSTILSNVAQIAEELVCNSLDADATKIEIAVDGEACHMQVDDDGCGINRDNLTLVGERHATSKLHSLDELEGGVATLGFRGEALSSLSDVALVEITSRCRGMPNTYRKILKGGATLSIGLSGEQRTHGTRVLVRDMFYNQPVRRRLLNSSHRKILQSVKECVLRYVLIHPQVSFTVRDLARKDILLHTKTAATLNRTLCDAFGEDTVSRLQEIDYAQGHLRLNGYLSKTCHSHPSKALQYLYINRRYVLRTALHKLINSFAGKSKEPLGQVNYDVQGTEGDMASSRQLFPAFVLQMTCPYSDYDITFEPSKTLVEFKDWKPVVSFVRSILQEIWGDQSVGRKQGFSEAYGTISAVPLVKPPGSGNNHRHKNSQQGNGSKDQFPPMAVRRALVLNGSHHPGDFNKSQRSKHTATATSDDMPEKPGTASKSSILPDSLPCTKMTKLEIPSRINSREYIVAKDARLLLSDDDSDCDCSVKSQTSWRIKPCRQRMEHSLAIPGSDWFPNGALSLELKERISLSQSSGAVITLSSDSGETSASIREKNQNKCSSFVDNRLLRSSSSPTDACESPLKRSVKKSRRNPGRIVRFRGDDDVRCLSPVEDIYKLRNEKWWEPDDLKFRTPPWSPVKGSTGTPRILDTSDILQEVSSCSPERSSSRKHPSHHWKLPEFDSEKIESMVDWSSRMQSKRQRVDYVDGSDSDERSELFSINSYSFDPNLEKNFDCSEKKKPKQISWKLDTEDRSVDMKNDIRYGSVTDFQEIKDDGTFSLDMDERGDTLQHEDYDIEVDIYNAWAKRRLDFDLDTSSENLKLPFDLFEKQKPDKQNKAHDGCASTLNYTRRRYSGPPFYKPPTRHGVHMNPLNSLSTVETMESMAEDAVATPMEPDRRSKVGPGAHREINQKREMPQKKTQVTEVTNIHSEEPRLDGNGQLAIQSRRPLDLGELDNRGPKINSEAERPLDAVKSIHEEVELDHQRCKYRSTDVTSKTPDGAELPKDTVKAMFKEWSNPCIKKDDDILDLSSGILASDVNSFLPGSITKDVLKQARVLQQVDTKFIAAVSCGELLLIDQHAADERVRLEELRKNVLDGNMTKRISLLSRPQQLTMTFAEQQTLQTYCQQIQDWGWRFKVTSDKRPPTSQRNSSNSGGICKVLLNAVPSILGVKLTGADLVEYLQQLTDTQGSSTPPPAVFRLLNNKACRGAIMFGDKLLPAECSQLVDHLKRTLLCFQCAHGRPTMIPLVDIQALHKFFDQSSGINMPGANMDSNTGFDVTRRANASRRRWHGLQLDVKPSLERAQARLAQAQTL